MTAPTVELATLLEVKQGFRQGRPCLRGTGLTVHHVAATYRSGHSVEEMCESNPDLNPSLFHAAIAYYLANRVFIDAEIEEDLRAEAEAAAASPHQPSVS